MEHFSQHIIFLTTCDEEPYTTEVDAISDCEGNFYFFADIPSLHLQKLMVKPDVMLDVMVDDDLQLRVIGQAEVLTESASIRPETFMNLLHIDMDSDRTDQMTLVKVSSIQTAYVQLPAQNDDPYFWDSSSTLPN